jgi:hypothetical protein
MKPSAMLNRILLAVAVALLAAALYDFLFKAGSSSSLLTIVAACLLVVSFSLRMVAQKKA